MSLEQALKRPSNYGSLPSAEQWAIDKQLGILDWEPTAYERERYRVRMLQDSQVRAFATELPAPFPLLLRDGPTLGLVFFVEENSTCVEWHDDPVVEIVRVECWVARGDQYVYVERLNPGDEWSVPVMGEHPGDGEKVHTLEDILPWVDLRWELEDLHPALHRFTPKSKDPLLIRMARMLVAYGDILPPRPGDTEAVMRRTGLTAEELATTVMHAREFLTEFEALPAIHARHGRISRSSSSS